MHILKLCRIVPRFKANNSVFNEGAKALKPDKKKIKLQ